MTSNDGVLHANFSDVEISMPEYNVTIDGSSDLSRTMEILMKNFKKFIQKELANVMAYRLSKSVEFSLNNQLSKSGDMIDVDPSGGNYWNVTLLADPVFQPNYISFVLDGSFHSSNSLLRNEQARNTEPPEFPRMPVFVGSPNSSTVKVQLFISDSALNQAMLTLYDNGGLRKGYRVPSTYLKTFISNFEEVFGKQKDVFILTEAMAPPHFKISQSGSTMEAEVSLRILNPFNEDFDAVYMTMKLKAEIEFELLQDFLLILNVKES